MTEPLKPETPAQIGSVVGVDRMDHLDRAKLDPRVKLQLLCEETRNLTGRDPRGGGHVFVGRPRVILQLMLDLLAIGALGDLKLRRPIVVGQGGGDEVAEWCSVVFVVRCSVVDDRLYCMSEDKLPLSRMIDRRQAGALRVHANAGRLEQLRENEQ